jgi:Amt family ammonium transporter
VHGVGGFTGLMLTAVFSAAAFDGLGLPEGVTIGQQLVTQLIGAVATVAWSGIATFVILKVVNIIVPLRVSPEQENEGLDLVSHEERGYNL